MKIPNSVEGNLVFGNWLGIYGNTEQQSAGQNSHILGSPENQRASRWFLCLFIVLMYPLDETL